MISLRKSSFILVEVSEGFVPGQVSSVMCISWFAGQISFGIIYLLVLLGKSPLALAAPDLSVGKSPLALVLVLALVSDCSLGKSPLAQNTTFLYLLYFG